MIDERQWETTKRKFPVGAVVTGTVVRVEPFGVFVQVTDCEAHAVLLVTEFEDGDRSFDMDEYPQIGQSITAVIVDHADHNRQLRLSTRSSAFPR